MEYLLKVSAVTVIFYVFYKIFLQRDTFFESNRWFLLIGLITSVFIPLFVIPIYVEQTPVSLDAFVFTEDAVITNNNSSINLLSLLKTAYFLGIFLFTLRFMLQLKSLFPLLITSETQKLGRFKFLKTQENISPFSFFNYIVYNPQPFNETELEQIISHEKVHVQQYHTIDVILAQIACIAFWFNPFIWLYNNDLKQNLEFIADKTAINDANCKKSYQYTLLKTSVPKHHLALTNNFYNSLIKKRIVMLHKSKSKKINLLKYSLIIPVLGLFLMSFNTKEVIVEKPFVSEKAENQDVKSLKTSSIEVIIKKDYSDSDFEKLKTKFKNEGLAIKIKGIKRNQQGEITAIKIDVSSKSSNANYSIDADEAINPIKISVDDDGKNISIGNSQLKKEHNMVFISEDGQKHEINNSDSDNHVFIISTDDGSEDHIEIKKFSVKTGDSLHVKKIHKKMNGDDKKGHKVIKIKTDGTDDDLTWTTEEAEEIIFIAKDDDAIKKHKVVKINTDGKEPLYLIDGKEITREEMNNISPETIDKVEVLKGDSATEKYGDKGKYGVVLITTKKKN